MYLITITVNPDLSAEQHETLFPNTPSGSKNTLLQAPFCSPHRLPIPKRIRA